MKQDGAEHSKRHASIHNEANVSLSSEGVGITILG